MLQGPLRSVNSILMPQNLYDTAPLHQFVVARNPFLVSIPTRDQN